jgi:glycosyltransferase involved in cell wall biosynthesis
MKIAVFPEGPLAYDGKNYRYSKGERLYLDKLAQSASELVIIAFVYKKGHPDWEACAHSVFKSKNLRVIELPFNPCKKVGVIGKVVHFTKVLFTLWRNVRNYDLLYLFLPSYPSAMAWFVGRMRRIPYIVYAASDWEAVSNTMFKWDRKKRPLLYRSFCWLNKKMEQIIPRKALFCVTAGKTLLKKYQRFSKNVFETIPRITLKHDDIFYRDNTCENDLITLISVGDLIPRKKLNTLINAFAQVYSKHPNLRLKLVGEGMLEEELAQRCEDLNVDKFVDFVGYVEKEAELYQLYREADMYVLASEAEGFPRVLYESMSQSLPIITTDCGGVTGLIKDHVNGLVVPIGDENKLVEAIEELITNAELRKTIILHERKTIKQVLDNIDPKQIFHLLDKYYPKSN